MKTLPVKYLEEGMVLRRDVYSTESVIPLLRKNRILTRALIRSLYDYGVDEVAVVSDDDGLDEEEVIIPEYKPAIDEGLKQEALESLEDIFQMVEKGEEYAPQVIKHMDQVVNQLVVCLKEDQRALVNIISLKSYDDYTYHHSLSVAVMSIAIGNSFGLNTQELNALGRAAMMHDIGKIMVPIEIINKPARLDDDEFAMVKNHSTEGYRYLKENGIGDEIMCRVVLCHHEKYNGSGYPLGLAGEQIPLHSRIISVADVYDALTSNRPYRTPLQPAEAVEYIMGDVEQSFDFDVVRSFVRKLELYPLGSVVELSDGTVGAVVDNVNTMRPVVKVLSTRDVLDLYWDRSCLNLTVKRLLHT